MFSFLRRLKPHDEMPEPEQQLSVRERALEVFSNIEGLDDIKEMMLRALEGSHVINRGTFLCKIPLYAADRKIHVIQGLLCRRSIYHQSGATEVYS